MPGYGSISHLPSPDSGYFYELYGFESADDSEWFRSDRISALKTQKCASARDQIASELGISNTTISNLRFIRQHRPDVLPHIGPSITLTAAATQVRLFAIQDRLIKDKVKSNGYLSRGKRWKIYCQSSKKMRQLDDGSVDVAMFSPLYFNLRIFSGTQAEIGGEKNAEDYVNNLVEICAEVHRVLKPTGSVFINLGDKMRARTRL